MVWLVMSDLYVLWDAVIHCFVRNGFELLETTLWLGRDVLGGYSTEGEIVVFILQLDIYLSTSQLGIYLSIIYFIS